MCAVARTIAPDPALILFVQDPLTSRSGRLRDVHVYTKTRDRRSRNAAGIELQQRTIIVSARSIAQEQEAEDWTARSFFGKKEIPVYTGSVSFSEMKLEKHLYIHGFNVTLALSLDTRVSQLLFLFIRV